MCVCVCDQLEETSKDSFCCEYFKFFDHKRGTGNYMPECRHEVSSLNKILCMFSVNQDNGGRLGRGSRKGLHNFFLALKVEDCLLRIICSNLSRKYTILISAGSIVQITSEPLSMFGVDEVEKDHLLACARSPVS